MRVQAALILAPFLGQTLTPEVAAAIVAQFPRAGQPLDLGQFPRRECGRLAFAAERGADILAELDVLHREQWEETERYMRGQKMDPAVEECLMDEACGRLVQLTARDRASGALVGQMRMYLSRSRHVRTLPIATEDTLYLLPEYRGGRAALRFLQYMEDCMLVLHDEVGVYLDDKVAAPGVGKLLDFMQYEHIANRRFKRLTKGKDHVRT